jgi:hypothetical protein
MFLKMREPAGTSDPFLDLRRKGIRAGAAVKCLAKCEGEVVVCEAEAHLERRWGGRKKVW